MNRGADVIGAGMVVNDWGAFTGQVGGWWVGGGWVVMMVISNLALCSGHYLNRAVGHRVSLQT